jgi:hypothetical protein
MWWKAIDVYSHFGLPFGDLAPIAVRPSEKEHVEVVTIQDFGGCNKVSLAGCGKLNHKIGAKACDGCR